MMRFFGYFRSSAAYRCRIGFNLKGVAPEFVPVHLRHGEQRSAGYLAMNPQGLVPALETAGGVITQSLAILEWLEDTIPEPAFLPADPVARAQARAFAQIIACDIHPLQNLRVIDHLRTGCGLDQDAIDAWLARWLGDGLAACEALLQARGGGTRFAFGDEPGLADILLVPQMFSARRFGVSLDDMPRLRAVDDACNALPAFARAAPGAQPDAEP